MIRFLKLTLFLGIIFAIQYFCRKATDDFAIELIKQPLQTSQTPVSRKVSSVLSQRFSYLGSGGQCFAFVSEDGDYVLKVFKHHHLRLPALIAQIAPESIKEKFARKERDLMLSCRIAANELADETGVIYLHLEDDSEVPSHIRLVDKLHIVHDVPSHCLPFVLQRKAVPIFSHLKDLHGSAAKAGIDKLVALVRARCERGIADADPFLDRNFGFVGDEIIEFDIGSFSYEPMLKFSEHMRQEMYFELTAFQRRLRKTYPKLAIYLQNYVDALLNDLSF